MRLGLFFVLFCVPVVFFASAHIEMTHAQSLEDGLGGHWTFDKADTDAKVAKDALGENDGEIKGAPKIVEGIVGDALSFNGKEDYVVMGAATTGQDLTYAMWIKPTQPSPRVRRLLSGTMIHRAVATHGWNFWRMARYKPKEVATGSVSSKLRQLLKRTNGRT